ncbi:MAG: TetR/AcrR family transcriptional regulator [Jatrophihabitans sp.]
MTVLSRADRQAQTRGQLLATARVLFLRDGYFATSLERVADEAGYSKGAVYSNFSSKDELCLAVLDEIRGEQAARLIAAISAGATFEQRLLCFEAWAETAIGHEGWSNLEIEFGSQLRRNPGLREQYQARGNVIRAALTHLIEAAADDLGTGLLLPADELATALLSLGVGLGLQRAVDHDVPVRTLTDVVRALSGVAVPVR